MWCDARAQFLRTFVYTRKSREESFPVPALGGRRARAVSPTYRTRGGAARSPRGASRSLPPATIRSLSRPCVRTATAQWLVQRVHRSRFEDDFYFTPRPLPHHWWGPIFLAAWCNLWVHDACREVRGMVARLDNRGHCWLSITNVSSINDTDLREVLDT